MATDIAPILSENTLIPVGAAVAVVLAMFFGYKYLRDQFDMVRQQREREAGNLREALDRLCARLEAVERHQRSRWTLDHMRIWELEFQKRNPAVAVPDAVRVVLAGETIE